MQEYEKKDIEELFPGESYYKAINLIRKVKRLVPVTSKSSIDYLETIISYVDGLINGDDIYSYTTFTYASKYAKIAFKEITSEVHDQILDEYRRERAELQEEVSDLSNKQQVLASSVEDLEKRKKDLQEQSGVLSVELAAIKKELEDLRQNGIARVNAEVASAKENLDKEIAALTQTKEGLNSSINELKAMLSEYSGTISKLNGEDSEVIWKPIDNNDPIYNTNHRTIASYIESMKIEYMDKTGVSREICDKEFSKYMPGLTQFIDLLKDFTNPEVIACSSLKAIIEHENWTTSAYHKALSLMSMLKTFKVPSYQLKHSNIDVQSLSVDTIPTNINAMLRELYLQRMAIEAVTKQKIAEAELKSVIAVLKTVAPKDFDFRSLISAYSGIDSLLPGAIQDEKLILPNVEEKMKVK